MPDNTMDEPEDARLRLTSAALAAWPDAAEAQVESVRIAGDRAEVHVVLNDNYDYYEGFALHDGRWCATHSSNASSLD